MRRATPAAALALLASIAAFASIASPVRAGDPAGDAVARLVGEWDKSDDTARQVLVDGVAAAPDPRGLTALFDVARSSFSRAKTLEGQRQQLEDQIRELTPEGAPVPPPPNIEAELAALRSDLAKIPKMEAREARGREFLSPAVPRVLDALADSVFDASAAEALRKALRGAPPGLASWLAAALGGARKERTAPLFVALAVDALKDYRKSLADRAGPARKLEDVNEKIADNLDRYLKAQQEKGDFSGRVPVGLLGKLDQDKAVLEREVLKFQSAMEEADGRRLAARTALAGMLGAAEPAARERLLDLVERKVLADADVDLRAFGVGALGGAPGERANGLLKVALADPDVRVVVGALDALGVRDEPEAVNALRAKLYDARWPVRAAAVASLGKTGRAAAAGALVEAMAAAKGRDLDDIRAALRMLTGKDFAAAPGPWKDWWDREGRTFKGAKERPPDAVPLAGDAPAAPPSSGLDVPEGEEGTRFYGIETHSTRVLFVLDFSGSMNFAGSEKDGTRKKVDVLREELRKALTGLPDGSKFNLVTFANGVNVWKKVPAVRDRASLNDAIAWVAKTGALGSTNIYDALETGFKLIGGGGGKDKAAEPAFDTVFFMTDGKPTSGKVTDPKLILGDVRRWNEARKVRLHVVGMGGHGKNLPPGAEAADDLDESFLKSLAEQNGGQCVIR